MANLKTLIVVQLQVEGLHCWAQAPEDEVQFLRDLHHHYFFIKVMKQVGQDRQIEIIKFRREVTEYLRQHYFSAERNCHFFGSMSCEEIARNLLTVFQAESVEVTEDGINGAVVCRA